MGRPTDPRCESGKALTTDYADVFASGGALWNIAQQHGCGGRPGRPTTLQRSGLRPPL